MERIVDIAQDQRHLCLKRGFLIVEHEGAELGRVSLDNIGGVLIHGRGVTYSNALLMEFAERNIPVALCAVNHFPKAWIFPIQGCHNQGARMRSQWTAPQHLINRLWRDLVRAKIAAQADCLAHVNKKASEGLRKTIRTVLSGDPGNVEAQVARRYWPSLFGLDFRRERSGGGINAMLNYGYTILRLYNITGNNSASYYRRGASPNNWACTSKYV